MSLVLSPTVPPGHIHLPSSQAHAAHSGPPAPDVNTEAVRKIEGKTLRGSNSMSTEHSGPEVQIQGPKQVRKCKTMKAGNGGPSRQHFLHLHRVPPGEDTVLCGPVAGSALGHLVRRLEAQEPCFFPELRFRFRFWARGAPCCPAVLRAPVPQREVGLGANGGNPLCAPKHATQVSLQRC